MTLAPLTPPDRWALIAKRRWNRYLGDVEREAILDACKSSGRSMIHALPYSYALDVGCGTGRWADLLATLGWELICIDTDSAALAVCQSRVPSALCLLAYRDDTTLPNSAINVNLVMVVEVPWIMSAPWLPAELNRVLRPSGIFVGVHLNRCSWRGWLGRLIGNGEFYRQSYAAWRASMVKAGFTVVSERGFAWAPLSRSSDSRLVPLCARLERWLGLGRLCRFSPWVVVTIKKGAT